MRHVRFLILTIVLAVGLRLPYLLLDELGRDEAAYLYWSFDPRPAYSPLVQWVLRSFRSLPIDVVLSSRLASILAMLCALVFFERWLRLRDIGGRARVLAVALVAVSPWAVYAGSLVHPDSFLLATLMITVWAAREERLDLVGLSAGAALWAKPVGLIVVVGVLPWLLLRNSQRKWFGLLWMLGLSTYPLVQADLSLIRGITEFSKAEADVSPLFRLWTLLVTTILLGGPALLVAGALGLWQGAQRLYRQARMPSLASILGVLFVVGFLGAALMTRQVKGNWMLPGFILLWPRQWPEWFQKRPVLAGALVFSVLVGGGMGVGFANPDLVERIEHSISVPSYLSVAGEREGRVASAQSWNERLREYEGTRKLAEEITALCDGQWPLVIISDDYGLAAQIAISRPSAVPRLVLPFDPIFASESLDIAGALVIAVRQEPGELVGVEYSTTPIGVVEHPASSGRVTIARCIRLQTSEHP